MGLVGQVVDHPSILGDVRLSPVLVLLEVLVCFGWVGVGMLHVALGSVCCVLCGGLCRCGGGGGRRPM